jgi:hypothetical protein
MKLLAKSYIFALGNACGELKWQNGLKIDI